MAAMVIKELCIGCGVCKQVCLLEAISVRAQKAFVDISRCDECEECIFVCPNGAITISHI